MADGTIIKMFVPRLHKSNATTVKEENERVIEYI
jgi:hypothetical protein